MGKNTGLVVAMVLAFLVFGASANANTSIIKKGESAICENASWIAYNLSEATETNVEFDVGPQQMAYEKKYKVAIAPGGFESNSIAMKSVITNAGPGDISVNCQRQLFDRHDWKIDAGSGKTYQDNYKMDHITPQTYIEPGLGQPLGTEGRDIFGTQGNRSEANR